MMIDGQERFRRHTDPLGLSRYCRGCGQDLIDDGNQLSPAAIDPNAYTPEFKGFLVKIEKA